MLDETEISETSLTTKLQQTRATGAPPRELAGIYAELTDFYLGEAASAHAQSSMPPGGTETRPAHELLPADSQAQKNYQRIVALQDHESGTWGSRFAALRSFMPGRGSNPYAGLAHASYFCRRAAEGIFSGQPQSHEEALLKREIAGLAAAQEQLITQLATRLLETRRDAIAALTGDAGYSGAVREKLQKASEAAQGAVQSMEQEAKARPAPQRGAGAGAGG